MNTTIETAGENLLNFSIDRNDIRQAIERIPGEIEINRIAIEYELQILKIITVGWGLAYFMPETHVKKELAETFWKNIREFSRTVSNASSCFIGKDFDYFTILKERLDMYVNKLAEKPDASDPAAVIGPVFANICGNADNVFAVYAGARIFKFSLEAVREYIQSVNIQ